MQNTEKSWPDFFYYKKNFCWLTVPRLQDIPTRQFAFNNCLRFDTVFFCSSADVFQGRKCSIVMHSHVSMSDIRGVQPATGPPEAPVSLGGIFGTSATRLESPSTFYGRHMQRYTGYPVWEAFIRPWIPVPYNILYVQEVLAIWYGEYNMKIRKDFLDTQYIVLFVKFKRLCLKVLSVNRFHSTIHLYSSYMWIIEYVWATEFEILYEPWRNWLKKDSQPLFCRDEFSRKLKYFLRELYFSFSSPRPQTIQGRSQVSV